MNQTKERTPAIKPVIYDPEQGVTHVNANNLSVANR